MDIDITLSNYKNELEKELEAILSFWMKNTVDNEYGGFIGKIDYNNSIIADAPKGSVLNARILWTFSSAYNLTGNTIYLDFANRAFDYIVNNFIDKQNGGVYWTVDYQGKPLDTKKQIYALAFTIYGLSEYYKASKNEQVLQHAQNLYNDIIKHSYDVVNGGYIEAFTIDWQDIEDLRLSDKESNEKKTMNTHLHVLEAFTTLYKVRPTADLKHKITGLVHNFLQHIINPATYHQYLFLNVGWQSKSTAISYGHDIETAWLLQEAAEVLQDEELLTAIKTTSTKIIKAVNNGLDKDGGLWYEYEPATNHLIKEKHSWPQAEAMVGFFNDWQNNNNIESLQKSINSWRFVKEFIHDKKNGEWFWGVKENYEPMLEDKAGLWKCPYHNSRACIEIIKRITQIQRNN